MILVKIHKTETSEIIAVCDAELIGKRFEEGNLALNITENFYKGKNLPKKEIIHLLEESRNVSIVGKESIQLALDHKIIDEMNVITIQGIPHAQMFSL